MWLISLDSLQYNYWVCQIFTFLSNSGISVMSHLIVLFSIERYYFLCRPIVYPRRITKTRIAVFLALVVLISWITRILNSLLNRPMVISFLSCVDYASRGLGLTLLGALLYGLPCVIATVFAVVNIKRLQKR